ncbi:DUF4038 domain-containing protein [Vibrio sp. PP-XX7]
MKKLIVFTAALLGLGGYTAQAASVVNGDIATTSSPPKILQVSDNGRFLQYSDGSPFFWLADTGWLLFQKLSREEANDYLQDRHDKGFNVIQVMVIHNLPETNFYGDTAFINKDFTQPNVTEGNSYWDPEAYDYWDHVDYILDLAQEKGITLAMVPVWGSVAKGQSDDPAWAETYAAWLADRFKRHANIVWLNGGDIRGDVKPDVWSAIGQTLDTFNPQTLISFHPFGSTQSSTWFHNASWLDFNMFQSGHRRYDQVPSYADPKTWNGEDNWKYVGTDYAKQPAKPTVDGEPSYENIPQGLHDSSQPYWTAADVRRYAYWSVFAGAFGHTYGDNAVMQMYKPDSGEGSYGVRNYWDEALQDEGAGQMQYLKQLILSRPFFERVPDQTLLAGANGSKYDHIVVTRVSVMRSFIHILAVRLMLRCKNSPLEQLKPVGLIPAMVQASGLEILAIVLCERLIHREKNLMVMIGCSSLTLLIQRIDEANRMSCTV